MDIRVLLEQMHAYGYKKIFLIIFLILIGAGMLILFRKKILEHRVTLTVIVGTTFLTMIPVLFWPGIYKGHDYLFHCVRLESLAQELKLGSFPARILSLWMDGYGYPCSIMYDDIWLYIPAVIRIIGYELQTALIWYMILINAGTAISSYLCFSRIFRDKRIGRILCFVYSLSSYRLVDIHTRSALGEYSAFLFFPIVILAVCEILYEEQIGGRQALLLAIGMSGILSVHVLSILIVGIGIVLAFLFHISVVRKKHFFPVILGAIGIFLALNAYYLVPFFDYYFTVPMNITNRTLSSSLFLRSDGKATVEQLFWFFHSIFIRRIQEVPLSPGLTLMLSIPVTLLLFALRKGTKKMAFLLGWAVLFLFMITDRFPWDTIVKACPFVIHLDILQFSWRLMILPILFLTLLLGECISVLLKDERLKQNGQRILISIIVLSGLVTLPFMYFDCGNKFTRAVYRDQWDLDLFYTSGREYLRAGSEIPLEKGTPVFGKTSGEVLGAVGSNWLISVEGSEADAFVQIPVFNYKGYRAEVEGTKETLPIVDGENAQIRLLLPERFSGKILIAFHEPWYWRFAEILSVIALICIVAITKSERIRIHSFPKVRKSDEMDR